MDFTYEEGDTDEVGSDIEAFCPKCRANTAHTVVTKYEDEVRRVQCGPCGEVHAYRKPRGDQETEDEIPEPLAAKKRAAAKKPSWQEAIDRVGHNKANNNARPYSIRDTYKEGDIVSHPKFAIGFVTEISENKVEVTFQDERRVLIHNRPDLAAVMPAIAAIPAPREEKKKKGKGAKGAKAAPPPPPAPPAAKGKVAAVAAKAPETKGDKKAAAKPAPAPAAPAAKKDAKTAATAKQGKVERAKAAVTKKTAAKGKPAAPAPKAKPAAKPATAKAAKPARPVRAAGKPTAKAAAKPVKAKAPKAKKAAGKR